MLAALAALEPAYGQAGSESGRRALRDAPGAIVYIRGGNVWLTDAAGAVQRPLTTDGGYRSPSMADDGTVGVLRNVGDENHFVRISPDGRALSGFARPRKLSVIDWARLSPDGRLFAFHFADSCNSYGSGNAMSGTTLVVCARTGITAADHWAFTDTSSANTKGNRHYPTWIGSQEVVVAGPGNQHTLQKFTIGRGSSRALIGFFDDVEGQIGMAEVSRDGRTMVTIRRPHGVDAGGNALGGPWEVAVFQSGPSGQVVMQSRLPLAGGVTMNATVSPDGRFVAFDDGGGLKLNVVGETGITVLDPLGKQPSWGAYAAPSGATPVSAVTAEARPVVIPSNESKPRPPNATSQLPALPPAQPPAQPIAAAAAPTYAAPTMPQAAPQGDPSSSVGLVFPPKRQYKNRDRVRQAYDKFTDTTRLGVTLSYSPGFLQRLYKTTVYVDLAAIFVGRTPSAAPGQVSLVIRLSDMTTASTIDADTLRIKSEAGASGAAKLAFVVDDTARFPVDVSPLGMRVVPWGDSTGVLRIENAFQAQLPVATLLRLAAAGHRVDARLRKTEFKVVSSELDALRDFASRLAPATAPPAAQRP
jgi:hypothetical protein